jgi:hypothetical protein
VRGPVRPPQSDSYFLKCGNATSLQLRGEDDLCRHTAPHAASGLHVVGEIGRGLQPELHEVADLSREQVALLARAGGSPACDEPLSIGCRPGHGAEESHIAPSDGLGSNRRVVPREDSGVLQLANTLKDSRSAEADRIPELLVTEPGICLKQGEQLAIKPVH